MNFPLDKSNPIVYYSCMSIEVRQNNPTQSDDDTILPKWLPVKMSRREFLASVGLTTGALVVYPMLQRLFPNKPPSPEISGDVMQVLPRELSRDKTDQIREHILKGVSEETKVRVAPVLPRGIGYVIDRGLPTRDFPDTNDENNKLTYEHTLFPNQDGEPFIYHYEATIIDSQGNIRIWTVRANSFSGSKRIDDKLAGPWFFSAKEFTLNGEKDAFISDTPVTLIEQEASRRIIP